MRAIHNPAQSQRRCTGGRWGSCSSPERPFSSRRVQANGPGALTPARLLGQPLHPTHASRAACSQESARARRAMRMAANAANGSHPAHSASNSNDSDVGVVIVDHGSRKAASNEMLVQFTLVYQQVTGARIVEVAHMEIAEPTIEQAVGKCAQAGARVVVIAPYFLSKGRHIQEDIPALVAEAQAKYPGVRCVVADPIGVDPLMAQLIHNRVRAALAGARSLVQQ